MKNMMKRFLTLALALALVLSCVPVYGFAAETGNAAKIGDTEYATLAEAVKAVAKGTTAAPTTITLLKDQTISSIMVGHQYAQNIIIDLNGYTLSSSGKTLTAYRSGTTLTLQNGTVSGNATGGTVYATYGGKLVLGDNLTVKGAGGSATLVKVDNGKLEVAANGVTFTGGKYDISVTDNVNNKVIAAAMLGDAANRKVNRTYYADLAAAIAAAEAGDTITLMGDVTSANKITVDKSLTIDGNGYTLTYTGADRAIDVPKTAVGANVTIKNLTVDVTSGYSQRGINYNTNGTLTLDNVTVKGDGVTYALNMPGSSAGAAVNVTNSDLSGCIALNIWGANATINVIDTALTSVDKTEVENYAAVSLNNDGTTIANGTVVTITGGSITALDENGEKSIAVRNSTLTGEINVSDTTVVNGNVVTNVAIVGYYGYNEFYSCSNLADAVAKATNDPNAYVKLLRDVTISAPITITGNVVIDGAGYTLTYTGTNRAIEVPVEANGANVTISNLDIVAESANRGINYNTHGKLTLNDVNVTLGKSSCGYALNVPTYGDTGIIEINGGKLYGGIAMNIWGSDMTINVNDAVLVSEETDPKFEYAAIQLNADAVNGHIADGTTVTVTGGSISATNDEDKTGIAVSNWTSTGKVIISDTTEVNGEQKIAVAWVAGACYYTLQEALDEVVEQKINAPIVLLRDISASEILTIPDGFDVTLDGNNYTLTSTAQRAINVNSSCNVTIKNLTINCSGERAVNVIQKPAKLTLDNVTATSWNYTLNVATSAGAAKVTVNNSTLTGLNTVNIAAPGADVVLTDSTINCNDNNTTQGEAYAALCLNKDATNAKITANGCTINVTKDSDSEVARNGASGGTITIDGSTENVKTSVAYIEQGEYYYSYETLAGAIERAKDGDTIVLLNDVKVDADDFDEIDGYPTFFKIAGKSITIDLNGQTIYADASAATENFVVGVFSTEDNGHLTLKDSSEEGTGTVQGYSGANKEAAYLDPAKGDWDYNYKFYSLLVVYDDDCSITVEGGNYILDYAGDSLAYTSCSEGIVVNGGTFKLGNLGSIRNGMPWVFNARGQNGRHVVVNGGTFCADIQHQYYCFEVYLAKEKALKYEDGMYTVVDAVAYVTEREWCCAWYTNEVGYATLEDAIAACEGPKTITYYKKPYTSEQESVVLLKDVALTGIINITKDMTLDMNGKTITVKVDDGGYSDAFRVLADVTVTGNGTIDADAGIGYAFFVGNDTTAGKLTIENGTFYGDVTAAQVTKGELIVNGGYFKATPYEGAHEFTLNCKDAYYNDGTAKITVNAGKFYMFDPANNAAEGPGTNFCSENAAVEIEYFCVADGLYKDSKGTYLVMDATGLENLNAKMADGSLGKGAKVKLMADIDFAGKTWTMVDSHADGKFYLTELDGNGHTISNLTVNGQAMFKRFAGSGDVTIKNLTFDNAVVDSSGKINTSILTIQSYQNVLLDNVDVKNSSITGGYKVAPLIATVFDEKESTITATLKNCDVKNVTVKATSYDFCTAGMVAFVYAGNNDKIEFENCTVTDVKLIAPNDSYKSHAAIYTIGGGSDTLFNEAAGVTVTNVTFEAF